MAMDDDYPSIQVSMTDRSISEHPYTEIQNQKPNKTFNIS